jgi:hypothetical protein
MFMDGTYKIEGLYAGEYEVIASGHFNEIGIPAFYTPRTITNIVLAPGETKTGVDIVFKHAIRNLNSANFPEWAIYTHTYDTSDGQFRIHYNSTGDGEHEVSSEYAEALGNSFQLANNFETSSMLYPSPIRRDRPTFDYDDLGRMCVYVAAIPNGYPGLTMVNPGLETGLALFWIRSDLQYFDLVATAYHEYYHAITFSNYFSVLDPPRDWLTEGTATWIEYQAASSDSNLAVYKNDILKMLSNQIPEYDKYLLDQNPASRNDNPPEKGLLTRKYDAFTYWLFMSRRFGSQIIKEIISSAHTTETISTLLKRNYGQSNSFSKTVDEWFRRLLTGVNNLADSQIFWGDDAMTIFDAWNSRFKKPTLFSADHILSSSSLQTTMRQKLVSGEYGAEYIQLIPDGTVKNIVMTFSVGPEAPYNTVFHVEVLGLKGTVLTVIDREEITLRNSATITIRDVSQSYDKIWLISVLQYGLGYYQLRFVRNALLENPVISS